MNRSSSPACLWLLAVACLLSRGFAAHADDGGLVVRVIDKATREPVPGFQYALGVTAADERPIPMWWDDWLSDRSWTGAVSLDVPVECQVQLIIRASGYVYSPKSTSVVLSPGSPREITVELDRGSTVRGIVTDKVTGQPIAGAVVSPGVFRTPVTTPEHSLCVYTDENGRFTLSGVRLQYFVEHEGHIKHEEMVRTPEGEGGAADRVSDVSIALDPGLTVRGVVVDRQGGPLGGASVLDPMTGKQAVTGEDGGFVVEGLDPRWAENGVSFWVTRYGYSRVDARIPPTRLDAVTIVMDELAPIRGRVTDAAGQPVQRFSIATGPGSKPADYQCDTRVFESQDGSFELPSEVGEGATWLAIWTPAHCTFERVVSTAEAKEPIDVALESGAEVRGRVVGLNKAYSGRVRMRGEGLALPIPRDTLQILGSEPYGMYLADRSCQIAADGTFVVSGLRPGVYTVHVTSDEFTGHRFLVEVDEAMRDIDLHAINVQDVGVVRGVATVGGQPLAYRTGTLSHAALSLDEDGEDGWYRSGGVNFQTDAHGRFEIRGVPAGVVNIGFSQLQGCFLTTQASAAIEVRPGETIDVNVSESTKSAAVCGNPNEDRIVTTDPVGVDGATVRITLSSSGPARIPTRIRLVHESKDEQLIYADHAFREPRMPQSITAQNLRPGRWMAIAESESERLGGIEFVVGGERQISVAIPLDTLVLSGL